MSRISRAAWRSLGTARPTPNHLMSLRSKPCPQKKPRQIPLANPPPKKKIYIYIYMNTNKQIKAKSQTMNIAFGRSGVLGDGDGRQQVVPGDHHHADARAAGRQHGLRHSVAWDRKRGLMPLDPRIRTKPRRFQASSCLCFPPPGEKHISSSDLHSL